MEIKVLRNYKSGFELVKSIAYVAMALGFAFGAVMYYLGQKEKKQLMETVYVVDNDGNTQIAHATSKSKIREYQIKAAIKKAYTLWYQIDEATYKANTAEALFYFGDCGKKMLKEYKDDQVYFNLMNKNLILTVTITDIKIDQATHKGYIEGIQTIKREDGKVERNMCASFSFYDISPSEMNPFGVKIENWDIYNDTVLKN